MASGNSLCVFVPVVSEPPTSNFATFDIRNVVLVLDFDDAVDESVEFAGFMPRHYGGGGITVTIGWMATAAIINDCIWDISFKSISDDADDLDSKAFAAVNSVTDVAPSASGEVAYAEVTFTDGADMDSIAAGEYFRLKISRDANNASDTLVGDAELVFIEIKET